MIKHRKEIRHKSIEASLARRHRLLELINNINNIYCNADDNKRFILSIVSLIMLSIIVLRVLMVTILMLTRRRRLLELPPNRQNPLPRLAAATSASYIYIYIYIYMCTYVNYTNIYIYVMICMYVCMYECMYE